MSVDFVYHVDDKELFMWIIRSSFLILENFLKLRTTRLLRIHFTKIPLLKYIYLRRRANACSFFSRVKQKMASILCSLQVWGDIIEKVIVVNFHSFFEYLYNTDVCLLIDRMKIETCQCVKEVALC